jgi:hypothetical protein
MRATPLVVAAAIMMGAAPASAQDDGNAPPGNAAVDQYQESIPTPSGNRPSASVNDDGRGRSVLDVQTARDLNQQGSAGQRLVELAEATGVPGGSRRPAVPGDRPKVSVGDAEGSSFLTSLATRSLTGAEGGGGGMGLALPVLLGVIALAGMAYAMRRKPVAG